MLPQGSYSRFLAAQGRGLRSLAVAMFVVALFPATSLQAEDYTQQIREAAKTWGMHRIAALEAAAGDVQDAKRTLTQIDEDGPKRPAEVTVVWFCNRTPIYQTAPTPAGWGAADGQGNQFFFRQDRAPDHVPTQVPAGLPANYLAADPRHGTVVDFTDEYDSGGARVTSRRYADGAIVIETPTRK